MFIINIFQFLYFKKLIKCIRDRLPLFSGNLDCHAEFATDLTFLDQLRLLDHHFEPTGLPRHEGNDVTAVTMVHDIVVSDVELPCRELCMQMQPVKRRRKI
jgi:hypothetical protein